MRLVNVSSGTSKFFSTRWTADSGGRYLGGTPTQYFERRYKKRFHSGAYNVFKRLGKDEFLLVALRSRRSLDARESHCRFHWICDSSPTTDLFDVAKLRP